MRVTCTPRAFYRELIDQSLPAHSIHGMRSTLAAFCAIGDIKDTGCIPTTLAFSR